MSAHIDTDLADFVNFRLPDERWRELEEHVSGCGRCAADVQWAERLRDEAIRGGLRHVPPMRIVSLAGGAKASDAETSHLKRCADCRGELEWARRQPAADDARSVGISRSRHSWRWLGAAAALILAVLAVMSFRGDERLSLLATIEPLPVRTTRDVPEGSFGEHRLAGLEAYAAGDWGAARASLAAAAELDPDHAEVRLYLGSAALLDGDRDAARDQLERCARQARSDRIRDEAVWQLANLALLENRRHETERRLRDLDAGGHRAADAADLMSRLP